MKVEAFQVIGISVRTSNANGQAAQDIGALWQKFMSEGLLDKIPNKVTNDIYGVYSEYESNHNLPYTAILGCKVTSIDDIPEGMIAHQIAAGTYKPFIAKGDLAQGVVVQKWSEIWEMDAELNRAYTSDFEVYGEKAQNPADAEVEIYIAV